MTTARPVILAALLAAVACTPVKPPKPPEPPPDSCASVICPPGTHCVAGKCITDPVPPPEEGRPTTPIGDFELRQEGGRFKYPITGVIPVWPPDVDGVAPATFKLDGKDIPYDWSLFSPAFADAAAAKGVTDLSIRLGPEPASDACCGLERVGGPLLGPRELNPAYWKLFHGAGRAAVKNKQRVLLSIGPDGWRIKHTLWDMLPGLRKAPMKGFDRWARNSGMLRGDGVHLPWSPEEIRHLMDVPLTDTVKWWVGQAVHESCNYKNFYYEISNEADLTPGWTPEWERAMYAEIRAAEQQPGCGQVVHMIGSNSRDVDGPYDFMVSHNPNETLVPVNGKPAAVTEYNPALSPATIQSKLCEAINAGQAYWFWRSDQTDEAFNKTMNLLRCDAQPEFSCAVTPLPDRSKLDFWMDCSRMASCDATPFIKGDHDHCEAVGMGTWPDGSWRWNCPLANEGDPRRLPCEQWALQRWAPLWKSDGAVSLVDAAGFRARTTGTWLQACDATEEHCSDPVEAP